MNILKFITAGSVDDGKSTLIGRLLFDSKAVSHDILHTLEKQSRNKNAGDLDLSLLTDGLRAEREQGITIDVAYKYFNTSKRKFIIADAPGHVQYTRNMVTGASNADLAIILVDARQGIVEQTHRHSLIAALMGIPHILVAVNKMDLVGYDEQVFYKIALDYQKLAQKLGLQEVKIIPISAVVGDNVVNKSKNTPWYTGETLLQHLETVEISHDLPEDQARFQVQYVIRPGHDDYHDYRGYAGALRSGFFKKGDRVRVLPSGIETTLKAIEVHQKEVDEAFAPQPVVLHLADDIDVSRGDSLIRVEDAQPVVSQDIELEICWMSERPLKVGDRYLLRHNAAHTKAVVKEIHHRVDVHSFEPHAIDAIQLNDIARIKLRTARPLVFDAYRQNRASGGLILINETTFDTVAAGMLRELPREEPATTEFDI
ncbi:MAG: 50S ribosome-binding GTPase [Chitinophagales bacterium]|nr:50S ribosome-binding GTPase [Chitinophagales bacterium]